MLYLIVRGQDTDTLMVLCIGYKYPILSERKKCSFSILDTWCSYKGCGIKRQTYRVKNKQKCHWVNFISIIGEFLYLIQSQEKKVILRWLVNTPTSTANNIVMGVNLILNDHSNILVHVSIIIGLVFMSYKSNNYAKLGLGIWVMKNLIKSLVIIYSISSDTILYL